MSYSELFENAQAKKRRKKNEKLKAKSGEKERINDDEKECNAESAGAKNDRGEKNSESAERSKNLFSTDWDPESDELPVVSGKQMW